MKKRIDHHCNRRDFNRRSKQSVSARIVILACTFALILGGVFLGSSLLGTKQSKASDEQPRYKYYTSIQVENGDTLWAIAEEYMTREYENHAEYIAEIKKLNGLGEDDIHTGEHLVVPYYSAERL